MQFKRQAITAAIRNSGICAVMTTGLALGAATVSADTNPYMQDDESWISINGEIDSVSRDSFVLDYGEGTVQVWMDDGDRDADGYKLLSGDKVTVYGVVDDDFFEKTTIDASSVYVKNLGTIFLAGTTDSAALEKFAAVTPIKESQTSVQGTVSSVHDEEFVINTANRSVRVEVDDMDDNPLDDEGYLKISAGDYVKVIGEMDDDFFEGRELEADTIIKRHES